MHENVYGRTHSRESATIVSIKLAPYLFAHSRSSTMWETESTLRLTQRYGGRVGLVEVAQEEVHERVAFGNVDGRQRRWR